MELPGNESNGYIHSTRGIRNLTLDKKGIVVQPLCDVAVISYDNGVTLNFANYPSSDVLQELENIEKNNPGMIVLERSEPDPRMCVREGKLRQMLGYWINVPPVYSILELTDAIKKCFTEQHHLEVNVFSPSIAFIGEQDDGEGEYAKLMQ